jgi:hypothetical protein
MVYLFLEELDNVAVNGLVLSQLLGSPLLHTAMLIQACLVKRLSHKMDLYREFDSQWSHPQPAPRQSSPTPSHANTGRPLKGAKSQD